MVINRAPKAQHTAGMAEMAATIEELRVAVLAAAPAQHTQAVSVKLHEAQRELQTGHISGKAFALVAAALSLIGAWALGSRWVQSRARRAKRIMEAQVRAQVRSEHEQRHKVVPMHRYQPQGYSYR